MTVDLLWLLLLAVTSACAASAHPASAGPASSPEKPAQAKKAADAGQAADGAVRVEQVPSPLGRPLPGQRTAFLAALEKAPSAAQQFARTSGHDAALAAGDVLSALADALDALPDPDRRASKDITEVRFEAKRLRRSDRLSYTLPKWIQEGLVAALDGLEKLTPANDSSRFWIASARESQKSIDTKSSLTFQRAPVQDAVRSTIDSFIVVGQGLCACR